MRRLMFGLVSLVACSTTAREFGPSTFETTASPTVTGTEGTTYEFIDASLATRAIGGVVQSPNALVPIAGALVYVTDAPPQDAASEPTCGTCRKLEPGSFAISDARGEWTLQAPLGGHYLVTEKGRFRRVRAVDVPMPKPLELAPMLTMDPATTRLPARTDDSKGDRAPRIGLVRGGADPMELTLTKFGLGEDAITLYENPSAIVFDRPMLAQLDVLLLPCGNGALTATFTDVQENLHEFVTNGGRLLASDYRYDYAHRTWPKSFRWEEATVGKIRECAGCGSLYEAPAVDVDPQLSSWLTGMGTPTFTLHENYTRILEVTPTVGRDALGNVATITPKVWARTQLEDGQTFPATVSLDDGCGRVVVTTHHAEAEASNLLVPQELMLLYVLFENTACVLPRTMATPK